MSNPFRLEVDEIGYGMDPAAARRQFSLSLVVGLAVSRWPVSMRFVLRRPPPASQRRGAPACGDRNLSRRAPPPPSPPAQELD